VRFSTAYAYGESDDPRPQRHRPERRRFLPHVTIARVGRSAQPPQGALPDPPRAEFTGSRVTLYRSRLQAGGARYEALGSVALGTWVV